MVNNTDVNIHADTIYGIAQGDFAAAAVLITYGAVLGKTNPLQVCIFALAFALR